MIEVEIEKEKIDPGDDLHIVDHAVRVSAIDLQQRRVQVDEARVEEIHLEKVPQGRIPPRPRKALLQSEMIHESQPVQSRVAAQHRPPRKTPKLNLLQQQQPKKTQVTNVAVNHQTKGHHPHEVVQGLEMTVVLVLSTDRSDLVVAQVLAHCVVHDPILLKPVEHDRDPAHPLDHEMGTCLETFVDDQVQLHDGDTPPEVTAQEGEVLQDLDAKDRYPEVEVEVEARVVVIAIAVVRAVRAGVLVTVAVEV